MVKIAVTPSNVNIIPDHYRDSDGHYCLDLTDTSKIAITLQDDWEISGEVNKTAINRSYPMTIPATPKNNLLLEFLANENVVDSPFFQNGSLPAKVLTDGDVILDGVLIVTSFERMNGRVQSYEIMVLGKEKFWISTLQNTPLASLPYQNITFNTANVLSNIQSVVKYDGTNPYVFAPIFHGKLKNQIYGDFTTYNSWLAEDMSILIFLKYIFELMEQQLEGWIFVSSLIESDKFLHLVLHCLENFRQSVDDVKINKFKTYTNQSVTYTGVYSGKVDFNSKEYDENTLHDTYLDKTTIKKNGYYKIIANVSYTVESSSDIIIANQNSDFQIIKNGVIIHTNSTSTGGAGANSTYLTHGFVIELPLLAGDVLEYEVLLGVPTWSGNLPPNQQPTFNTMLESNSNLSLELQKEIFETTINPSNFINPTYSCWDLFEDVLTLHNCRLRTDYNLKQIIFEPANNYYKDNTQAIDWTDKVGGMKRTTEMVNSKRFYHFKYVQDRGDKYYNATLAGGRNTLYNKVYDFLEDNNGERFQGISEIKLNMLAASRMLKVSPSTDIPCVTENEIIGGNVDRNVLFYQIEEEAERTYQFSPRLFFWKGWNSHSSEIEWIFEGTTYQQYPMVQFINRYSNDEYNLSWEYLFEQYWKSHIQVNNLNGLISTFAILHKLDILNFDTRYKIRLGQNYYYLKLIEHWLVNKSFETAKIELIRAVI